MAASSSLTVGIIAIQGGVPEVAASVQRCGARAILIKHASEVSQCAALIIPGGESTTIGLGISSEHSGNLITAIREHIAAGKAVWGICAGMVLLANGVKIDADQKPLLFAQPIIGGLDIDVSRNFFGRQSRSRLVRLNIATDPNSSTAVRLGDSAYFIRAPAVIRVSANVTVLATVPAAGHTFDAPLGENVAAAVRNDRILATCFHPEISHDDSWMQYFLQAVVGAPVASSIEALPAAELAAPWSPPAGSLSTTPGSVAGDRHSAVRRAFAVYQQGGVIMDVVNAAQARVAEEAGAVAVMALERIPADIKRDGGVARSTDPALIKEIMSAISIPCFAKARIGHFVEAQILEALDIDGIDESEVLTAADEVYHIDKRSFAVPFVCGAKDLGEALRRISEGAAMIRLKGNAGTGNVVHAVRHARTVFAEIRALATLRDDEVFVRAKQVCYHRLSLFLFRSFH